MRALFVHSLLLETWTLTMNGFYMWSYVPCLVTQHALLWGQRFVCHGLQSGHTSVSSFITRCRRRLCVVLWRSPRPACCPAGEQRQTDASLVVTSPVSPNTKQLWSPLHDSSAAHFLLHGSFSENFKRIKVAWCDFYWPGVQPASVLLCRWEEGKNLSPCFIHTSLWLADWRLTQEQLMTLTGFDWQVQSFALTVRLNHQLSCLKSGDPNVSQICQMLRLRLADHAAPTGLYHLFRGHIKMLNLFYYFTGYYQTCWTWWKRKERALKVLVHLKQSSIS